MSEERLELSDEVIKYYEKILTKSKEQFANKQYQEAIARLEEELDQAYMPFEYQQMFEQQLFSFQTEYRYLQLDERLKKLTKPEMLKQIIANNSFNVYLFDYFLQTYYDNLSELDYFEISNWLTSQILNNTQKFYILDSLAHFNIDKNFVLHNHNVNDDVVLNTLTFHDHEAFAKYNQTLQIIENDLFKDPTIVKFASELLDAIASEYFPTFDFKSPELLAKIIINTIHTCMNCIEPEWDNLTEDERKVYKILINLQNTQS